MTISAETRSDYLRKTEENWRELVSTLESFADEEFDVPNVIGIWSLKDLVGHLETWDRIAIRKLDLAEDGRTEPWWKIERRSENDIDEFNESAADRKRYRPLEQLWSEMHATHAELVTRIESSPALSAGLIAIDTWDHYLDHLNDIHEWQQTLT